MFRLSLTNNNIVFRMNGLLQGDNEDNYKGS